MHRLPQVVAIVI